MVVLVLMPALLGRGLPQAAVSRETPIGFVSDRSCGACHPRERDAWSASHHAKAMQPMTDATALGDFDGAVITHLGVTTRFFKRDGKFFVNTEGADGRAADFQVTYTFGIDPLQQYLVEFPGGRLQALTIAWDTAAKRWFPLYPNERIRPDDPRHWTGRYQNWNLMCAECHTTNLRKGYDARTETYRTSWSEINVGCQACHGPGRAHVAWARSPSAARGTAAKDRGLVVDLVRASAAMQVDACARCHARRTRLEAEERFERPFADEFRPEWLRADLYHPDGQQLEEVYEYGSFRQSRMYQAGVRCTDCHEPHTGKVRATGNALCTGCHGERPDSRFPTLSPKIYDAPSHHFHRIGSPGSACVSCHMPAKRYMVLHARPDHSAPVPRPDLSATLGTPDACTACHAGQSPRWAADAVRRWNGETTQPRDASFAEAIAAGRTGSRQAQPSLIALARDPRVPAIVRATALDLLSGDSLDAVTTLLAATTDDDPMVRTASVSGLERLPPRERARALAPLLIDPIRMVRIEAARALAGPPREALDPAGRRALDTATEEFRCAQAAMADMPSSHASLAELEASLGRHARAEAEYGTALRMDPDLVSARTGLAVLLNALRRNTEAERVLREGITRTPARGELHYSLGLLLAEERPAEAVDVLRNAARLLPDRPRVQYNYGLALQHLGRRGEAQAALLRAAELDRDDPEIAYALAVLFVQQGRFPDARAWAERAARLAPDDRRARQLIERIPTASP